MKMPFFSLDFYLTLATSQCLNLCSSRATCVACVYKQQRTDSNNFSHSKLLLLLPPPLCAKSGCWCWNVNKTSITKAQSKKKCWKEWKARSELFEENLEPRSVEIGYKGTTYDDGQRARARTNWILKQQFYASNLNERELVKSFRT